MIIKNETGFTVTELVVSFAFISFVVVGMLTVAFNYRSKVFISNQQLEMAQYKDNVKRAIQDDINNLGISNIEKVDDYNLALTFADDTRKTIKIDPENKTITYDYRLFEIIDKNNRITLDTFTFSSETFDTENSIYNIIIPIYHADLEGDYNVYIVAAKDTYRPVFESASKFKATSFEFGGITFDINETTATMPNLFNISSATNGRGIYAFQENGEAVYYFRGKVNNNHVLFAGLCWEMVRTTYTGGMKLIYDGTPIGGSCTNTGAASQIGTSKFNSNSNNNTYVGYMYGSNSNNYETTHANDNSSIIKTTLDNWYKTNMTDYTDYLEDAIWCNDRSIAEQAALWVSEDKALGYSNKLTYYGPANRIIYSRRPSLKCSNENDKFTVSSDFGNGSLDYPVGLLTADEVVLAGGAYGGVDNKDYYLYTGAEYWTLSPLYFNEKVYFFKIHSNGRMNGYNAASSSGVRPVVSLNSTVKFTSGNGSTSNPYVVAK